VKVAAEERHSEVPAVVQDDSDLILIRKEAHSDHPDFLPAEMKTEEVFQEDQAIIREKGGHTEALKAAENEVLSDLRVNARQEGIHSDRKEEQAKGGLLVRAATVVEMEVSGEQAPGQDTEVPRKDRMNQEWKEGNTGGMETAVKEEGLLFRDAASTEETGEPMTGDLKEKTTTAGMIYSAGLVSRKGVRAKDL
jgi:hypothetical protein